MNGRMTDEELSDFSANRSNTNAGQYHRAESSINPHNPARPRGTSYSQHAPNPNSITPSEAQGGNLNRWSKSTTSSSAHSHQRSNSNSRRMSFGGGAFLDTTSSPPRKLHKHRISTAQSPSAQIKVSRTPFDPALITLPPMNTLPPLQTSVINNSSIKNSSPLTGATTPSPSTAQILSAAARTADYFGRGWENRDRDRDSSFGPKDFSHKKASDSRGSEGGSLIFGPAFTTTSEPSRGQGEEDVSPRSRGHSRQRSTTKGSASSSKSSKQPSQKAMLSRALQKANTAVLLDNAQNFDGAMQAYSEACTLLQQVMLRNNGNDRQKLEDIRSTYTSRIGELRRIAPHLRDDDGKALPERPPSEESGNVSFQTIDDEEEPVIIETATATRIMNDHSYLSHQPSRAIQPSQVPQRRESLLPSALENAGYRSRSLADQYTGRSFSKSPMRERAAEINLNLAPPMEIIYMPPPLSPRRPLSPMTHGPPNGNNTHEKKQLSDFLTPDFAGTPQQNGHTRAPSNESMSWLDTIDESGDSDDSAASSVHSRTSSMGVRRKHIRAPSGATEAEFDAALDAAVEAAYDDGFEPVDDLNEPIDEPTSRYDYDQDEEEPEDALASIRRKVELAKEKVRETERETKIIEARENERKRLLQQDQEQRNLFEDQYEGNESEEEERMLEEMTRGYVMEDFEFGLQSKSALPRESDSSGFSGRTWNSSIGSNPATAGTPLSSVAEGSSGPPTRVQSKTPPPQLPPPTQALPPPPVSSISTSQGVRSRRLSGQNAKQLKIETTTKVSLAQNGPMTQAPSMPPPELPNGNSNTDTPPKTAGLLQVRRPTGFSERPLVSQSARQASPFPGPSPSEPVQPPTPLLTQTLTQTLTNDSETNGQVPRSGSPGRAQSRAGLRKNFSSSSLKNMKSRNLSFSNIDDGSDMSPNTPLSSQFAREMNSKLPAIPALPTPIASAFKDKMNGGPSGGMYLFNNDLYSPESPDSPNPLSAGAPIPLEPCPTEFSLRPFWLMRALYQTIAHPRGGYLSTKLFVPRDVWRVKGVKIKSLEDKIANCDFLTAALMKLAQVDTFDADAVLEEMQALESVLEQVQATLAKKLGSEVGVQGSNGMFKDASIGGDAETSNSASKLGSMSNKSSTFSWRRLRSKNSGVGLSNAYATKIASDGTKEGLSMATLPMTSNAVAKVRFAKRDVNLVQFSGPNANYMGALARLFDAAQAIDQIARQVEDPGLRHADKTQVGIELCTRHAAGFFGFYICRFVLNDISLLLDKFIKRGSEWVLV